MSDFTMVIGGDRRAAAKTFGVINPSTGEVHEEAPDASREQLDEAMDAAAKAYIDWRERHRRPPCRPCRRART